MQGFHFFATFGVDGVPACAEDHKDNKPEEYGYRSPQIQVVTDGKKPLGVVYHEHGADKDRDLDTADDAGKEAECDKRTSENVREYDIVCEYSASEVQVDTSRCHFQFGHMRNKVQAFIRDEYTQNDSEYVEKARAMTITPPFYIGDNIHGVKRLIVTKFTKKERE